MSIDVLFAAKNRREFTEVALAALIKNTNWGLVRFCLLWDDGSEDGADLTLVTARGRVPCRSAVIRSDLGAPAAIMRRFIRYEKPPDYFAKIDNDVVVPPGWLDACAGVVREYPSLDLLGIEPPLSRTPRVARKSPEPAPEFSGLVTAPVVHTHGYAACRAIGGVGLMKTRAFLEGPPLEPHSIYGGFTEWQLNNPGVRKGWIAPPLRVFLLDRLPIEPWRSLSRTYVEKKWQREWTGYPETSSDLWSWWEPAPTTV